MWGALLRTGCGPENRTEPTGRVVPEVEGPRRTVLVGGTVLVRAVQTERSVAPRGHSEQCRRREARSDGQYVILRPPPSNWGLCPVDAGEAGPALESRGVLGTSSRVYGAGVTADIRRGPKVINLAGRKTRRGTQLYRAGRPLWGGQSIQARLSGWVIRTCMPRAPVHTLPPSFPCGLDSWQAPGRGGRTPLPCPPLPLYAGAGPIQRHADRRSCSHA